MNGGNLIVGFPGSTNAQIDETIRVIHEAAIYYPPLNVTTFRLEVDQSVVKLHESFPITNIRNWDAFRASLPPDVWSRLQTFYMSYDDCSAGPADWDRLAPAIQAWSAAINRVIERCTSARTLTYRHVDSSILLEDSIAGRSHTLEGPIADIYLYCTERRNLRQIAARFHNRGLDAHDIRTLLDTLVAERYTFREANSYLSLAVATTPHHAANRIRQTHADE